MCTCNIYESTEYREISVHMYFEKSALYCKSWKFDAEHASYSNPSARKVLQIISAINEQRCYFKYWWCIFFVVPVKFPKEKENTKRHPIYNLQL